MGVIERVARRSFRAGFCVSVLFVAGCAGMSSSARTGGLSGGQEVPPVTTAAAGTRTIAVGTDKSVSGVVRTTGVAVTATHIHQGAPGQTALVPVQSDAHKGGERSASN